MVLGKTLKCHEISQKYVINHGICRKKYFMELISMQTKYRMSVCSLTEKKYI